jgi:two-component system alkaline phosphatase synthesis response regulator PhoP
MRNKILIIDDSEQDRKIMQRYFNQAGFKEILMAERGEEGIEKAISQKPDLIIIDTLLPGMDGFQICQQIREKQGEVASKIVMVTGAIDAVDAVKARKMGADDYCAKTADCAPLIEIVKKFISC